jgi:peptide deformylase
MAVRPILQHPDPRLRAPTEPVAVFGPELAALVADLFDTMYAAPGVGLAANQIGVLKRLAVIDCAADKEAPQPLVLANPHIVEASDQTLMEEGCLSVDGYRDKVPRYRRVKLRAQDQNGKTFDLEADGLLAQAIQHEIDHLDGKLYIDYLSALKRERLKKKLAKEAKERAAAPAAAAR